MATSSGGGVLISIPAFFGFIYAGWGEAGLPPLSTGFVNWIAFAVIFPITMLVAPFGVQLAHRMNKLQLEVSFAVFLSFVLRRSLELGGVREVLESTSTQTKPGPRPAHASAAIRR